MKPERRKHTRYDQSDLSISVARSGIAGFLKLNPTTSCHDFSLSGLQFSSNQLFNIGAKLIVDLQVGNIEVCELNAVVVESRPGESGFCTRVQFCFDEKRMRKPQIMHCLLQIESRLKTDQLYPC